MGEERAEDDDEVWECPPKGECAEVGVEHFIKGFIGG
jgi:hypothetical protein